VKLLYGKVKEYFVCLFNIFVNITVAIRKVMQSYHTVDDNFIIS